MTWRDNMRPASFRGVPFSVEATESEHGRRVALHEYPGRDTPYAEDLGRRAREFTVEAFVIGGNYFPARDALLAAVETKGPGTLIHPYLGTRSVIAASCRLIETTREGRLARLLIVFVEAGLNLQPTARDDTAAGVAAAAKTALADIEDDFADAFTLAKQPESLLAAATKIVDDLARDLGALRVGIPAELTEAAGFLVAVDRLTPQVIALIDNPLGIAREITAVIRRVRRLATAPDLIFDALRGLSDFGGGREQVQITTGTRSVQARNQTALVALASRAAMTEMAIAATAVPLDNRQDALALRDDVAGRIDGEIAAIGDAPDRPGADRVFEGLRALRGAVVRDLTLRGASLVPLISRTLSADVPAAVLAYDLYEDIARDGEIVARNGVRHPGFVPGGAELELRAA